MKPPRVPGVVLVAVLMSQVLAGCSACGSGPVPRGLLGPAMGVLMQGNARGVYVAHVYSVAFNGGPLGFSPVRGEAGTFANVTIREALHQVSPGPEDDVPLQAEGDTLDVMVSSQDFKCPASNGRLQAGDRIIIFLWRAKVASHPNGSKVPWAWLRSGVLCMDGESVNVADTGRDGVQENGTVTLAQFREALSLPWGYQGTPLPGVSSDAGTGFLAERCAGVTCQGDSRCFFGAGCWSSQREGLAGCIDGQFFTDGSRCTSGIRRPVFN